MITYVSSITQATDTLRTLGLIDKGIAIAKTQRHRTIMDYLDGHLDRDSIMDSTYTAVHYMLGLGDKDFYKLAIGTTLSLDTLTWARTLLDTMEVDNAEDTAFFDWHDLALSLKEDTLTWFALDSTQLSLVQTIASDSTSMKGYAEAVLALRSDSSITRTPEALPELPSERRGQEDQNEQPQRATMADVVVFPNPFLNDFTIQYSLNYEAVALSFEVFDMTGRRIRDALVSNTKQGTLTVDLSPCIGFYMLRVIADGEVVHSNKLICLER
jgi:hypothetical protein